jgi:iron complex transport system substrate-binding protein
MKRLLAILLIFSLLFAGCTPDKDPDAGADSVTFTDALGREVTVSKDPSRVASLLGSFSDVWLLAGGELCASAHDAGEDFGIDMSLMTDLGGAHSPSLELLISARPDFVLASASTASNIKMKESLESMGITVAYFEVSRFEDYLEMLRICTSITGREDLYQKNGLEIKQKVEAIKSELQNAELPENERTVLLLRASASSIKAKGSRGTILGEMLADLGCINIADSDSSILESLSTESIIRKDPHRIFAVTMGDNVEGAMSALDNMINSDPAFSSLSAVREGRIHFMDKTLFNLKPNDRWAEAYETLANVLCETE